MASERKAFLVTTDYDGTGGVVFAKSAIEARRYGASEWNDGELGGLHVRRERDFDQFDGSGVPAWLMVAKGWWFECSGCGMTINEDSLYDRGLPVEGVVGAECSRVYCCATCEADERARTAREAAVGNAFLWHLKQRVIDRFGPVEFANGAWKEHVYAREVDGTVHIGQGIVSFNFPGMRIGPASLRYNWGYGGQFGPPSPEYSVPRGDLEAFEAWAAARPSEDTP